METPAEIEKIRQFLKKNFGPEAKPYLRRRLQIHLEDPAQDPLSAQVWDSYNQVLPLLKEPFSILDCGCMSGFFYHHLKKHKKDFQYTGIDRWREAIEVGKEFAPEADLRVADFLTFHGGVFDYIWVSNIPWSGNQFELARMNLTPLARRALIVAHPNTDLNIYGAEHLLAR